MVMDLLGPSLWDKWNTSRTIDVRWFGVCGQALALENFHSKGFCTEILSQKTFARTVGNADGEEVVFGGFRFSDEVERSGVRERRGCDPKARCVSRNCEIRERARAFGENRVEERRFRKLGVHAIVFVERKIAMARLSRG